MKRLAGRKRRQAGTTLIELMTAIFIISVLSSISIPVYRRSIDKSRFNSCESNLRNLVTAIETYHLESKIYPADLTSLVPPGYINSIPTCPSAGQPTYTAGYEFDNVSGEFTVSCKGTYHASLGYGQDEPFYTLSGGMMK